MKTSEEAKSDYWKSPEGLNRRIELIGEDYVFRIHNGALALVGNANLSALEWIGYIDVKTCDYCDGQIGRIYRQGQYIPSLPAHPWCRCSWHLINKEVVS